MSQIKHSTVWKIRFMARCFLLLVFVGCAVCVVLLYQYNPSRRHEPEKMTDFTIVHFVWCKRSWFQFQHYMSVKSVIKYLRPRLIFFHYDFLPKEDDGLYYMWFDELRKDIPNLILKPLKNAECIANIHIIVSLLDLFGGIYVPIDNIIIRTPGDPTTTSTSLKYNTHVMDRDIIYANDTMCSCTQLEVYEENTNDSPCCVFIQRELKPLDFRFTDSKFNSFARKLLYNNEAIPEPRRDEATASPRHLHLLFNDRWNVTYQVYLTLMSDLYVAEFDKVLIHTPKEPEGPYWSTIKKDPRVVWMKMEWPIKLLGRRVNFVKFVSDILRLQILQEYGGAYRDLDVIWTRRIPDVMFTYDAAIGYDWVPETHWPDKYNNGCLFGKKGGFFQKEWLIRYETHKGPINYYNSLLCPVKLHEMYPGAVLVDRYLQVICHCGVCHPPWINHFKSNFYVNFDVGKWDWNKTLAVHITEPKLLPELSSEDNLKRSTGIYGEIGRNVLHRKAQYDAQKTSPSDRI